MSRVLVVSSDFINQRMAGPAIRSYELARELHRAGNEVILASRAESDLPDPGFPIIAHDTSTLQQLAPKQDVIFFQGYILEAYPFIAASGARLVSDLYGPFNLELLVLKPLQKSANDLPMWDGTVSVVNEQLRVCDFFVCASEKQRDYWLGALSALNRVNPENFGRDPSLRSLIDLVPFGLPAEPPRRKGRAMRGVIPGIRDDDFILLGGTIYNWLDPLTLIRAAAMASAKHPNLRVVFMGIRHPNPYAPDSWMVHEAKRLATELGVINRIVFFNEEWVPYDRRGDWVLEADVGVSTHTDHIEAHLAFRTRFLDFFWAGVPILCTAGDTLGDTVERRQMGISVPPSDPDAIVRAIDMLADPVVRKQQAARVREYARELTWPNVAGPLVRFCADPQQAADLAAVQPARVRPVPLGDSEAAAAPRDWRYLAIKAMTTVLYQGPMSVLTKGRRYLGRRVNARLHPRPDRPLDPVQPRR